MVDPSLREFVLERASLCCEYCQMPVEYDPLPFQVDHIVALKHHGQTRGDNLALSCFACNSHKGPNIAGFDPKTGNIISLFHPRRDDWYDHFQWEGAVLVGRTPAGRATVDVLEINLPHRLVFRETLIAEGVFPPPSK
jgi:hypothetical protein